MLGTSTLSAFISAFIMDKLVRGRYGAQVLRVCLLSIPFFAAATLRADEDAKDAATTDRHKVANQQLDELEAEIQQAEEAKRYGSERVRGLVDELSAEFHRNARAIDDAAIADTEPEIDGLVERQQMIRLYLWELERVGPLVSAPSVPARTRLMERLNKWYREYRKKETDPKVIQRFSNLSRRSSQLGLHSMMRRRSIGFYLPQPARSQGDLNATASELPRHRAMMPPKNGMATGPIDGAQLELQAILKLKWSGEMLKIDTDHWDTPFCGKSLANIADDVQEQLKVRGILPATADSNAGGRRQPPRQNLPNIALLFQNLAHWTSSGDGSGRPLAQSMLSPNRQNAMAEQRFTSGGIDARLAAGGQGFDLQLSELATPNRVMRVLTVGDRLEIRMLGDNVLKLSQRPEGGATLVSIIGDSVESISAESFVALYRQHPEVLEQSVFPFLQQLGFLLPWTRFDPAVVDQVVASIRGIDAGTQERFESLLTQIDSTRFSLRETAARELRSDVEKYATLIRQSLGRDGLSLEVRDRLERAQQALDPGLFEIRDFVLSMGLTADPEYLQDLLPLLGDAESARLLSERLQHLASGR